MRMRVSLALGERRPLSRQTAWGCFTANLAVPGSGSLLAGRFSGYPQLALAVGGLLLSLIFGVRLAIWALANWSRLHQPETDPLTNLAEFWMAVRWPLLGIAVFAAGWLWALGSSMLILSAARRDESKAVPPRLS